MRTLTLIVSLLTVPSLSAAQEIRSFASPMDVGSAATATDFGADFAAAERPDRGPGTLRTILTAAGGAAVGAWVGYMASQVAVGDWEDQPGIRRENWAAGGALAGLTLGLTLPLGNRPGRPLEAEQDERARLLGGEIDKTGAPTLFDAIQSLRPEWLRPRGTGSMRETPRGTATTAADGDWEIDVQPGIPTIRVYLDDSYLGGVEELRLVSPGMVGDVRFLDAAEATQRWGAGHLHGAIHIRSVVP